MILNFISANIIRRTPHLSYSPDLAHCDFYLFGYVKEFLTEREFADREELLAAITHILKSIENLILERVFLV
jgi:hypothetical protein